MPRGRGVRPPRGPEDILIKMRSCVRNNNGIKVLLSLLLVKTPLVNADLIRALACKALCGLSRSDKIKQVIGKLQLFNSGQLQSKSGWHCWKLPQSQGSIVYIPVICALDNIFLQ